MDDVANLSAQGYALGNCTPSASHADALLDYTNRMFLLYGSAEEGCELDGAVRAFASDRDGARSFPPLA